MSNVFNPLEASTAASVASRFAQRARRAADVIASWLGERDGPNSPSVQHALVAVSTHICLNAPEVTFCAITDRSGRVLASTDNSALQASSHMIDAPLAVEGSALKFHRDSTRTREMVRVSIHSADSDDPLGELWVGYHSNRGRPPLELAE